jgi:hypothetical protein
MRLLWKKCVHCFVSSAVGQPGMNQGYCNWLGMACIAGKFVGWWKQAGWRSGSGVFYAWPVAIL